jgi:hypothetical protein
MAASIVKEIQAVMMKEKDISASFVHETRSFLHLV